jgi:hypothetical protein
MLIIVTMPIATISAFSSEVMLSFAVSAFETAGM